MDSESPVARSMRHSRFDSMANRESPCAARAQLHHRSIDAFPVFRSPISLPVKVTRGWVGCFPGRPFPPVSTPAADRGSEPMPKQSATCASAG